ncbi:hypothetical protein B0T21DRAFT_376492 [Apiosordaria backusii]|uniref:Uncharacterized protein n=1 Tax=Apiosordaria backusii TaxID=314023 RepID=A0AA40A6Y4_9PEZI|nr:hypothetical protein B0T21DRAFT_376492 [Apiosordaria backusii]
MDLFWRGSGFLQGQYSYFSYEPEHETGSTVVNSPWPPVTVIQYIPDQNYPRYTRTQHSRTLSTAAAWQAWLQTIPIARDPDTQLRPSVSIILFPRHNHGITPTLPVRDVSTLKYLPISLTIFQRVVETFNIHQALQILINRGKSTIWRFHPCPSKNQYTYLLRTDNTLENDLALSVYYDANDKALRAVFFGCTEQDVRWIQGRLQVGTGKTALAPLTMISALLELERGHRVSDVDKYDRLMTELVENFPENLNSGARTSQNRYNEDDPEGLFGVSRAVTYMKGRLERWKAEIGRLQNDASEVEFLPFMDDPVDGANPKVPLIHYKGYLAHLMDDYEDRIRKCSSILDTASQAFQMEIAASARKQANKMKTLAIMTMVFLPATFLSTLFALSMFQWRPDPPAKRPDPGSDAGEVPPEEGQDESVVSPWFYRLYIPLSVGITLMILASYWWAPITRWCRGLWRHRKATRSTDIEMR